MVFDYVLADPSGNITVLVTTPYNEYDRGDIIREAFRLEPECEQVGFFESVSPGHAGLEMMGYEFCGNATLSSAAYEVLRQGLEPGGESVVTIDSSGIEEPVEVSIRRLDDVTDGGSACPCFEGSFYVSEPAVGSFRGEPVIHMDGISHLLVLASDMTPEQAEENIRQFADELDTPALGIMLVTPPADDPGEDDVTGPLLTSPGSVSMRPLVYVRDSDTLFWEHCCATGSTAVGWYRFFRNCRCVSTDIVMPGGTITIRIINGRPLLSGKVTLRKEVSHQI